MHPFSTAITIHACDRLTSHIVVREKKERHEGKKKPRRIDVHRFRK